MALPSYIENMETWREGFKYSDQVTVRFSETDAFGHMNNTVPFIYFEQARINYFKEIGLSEEWFSESGGAIIVTADLHCDYIKQVFFDETLRIFVKVAYVGRSSLDLHYMIVNEKDEVVVTGRGRIVQISRGTGKPLPWSDYALSCIEVS